MILRRFISIFSCLLTLAGAWVIVSCDTPSKNSQASQDRLQMYLSTSNIPADGASTVSVSVYVIDRNGNPETGSISFKASQGSFEEQASFPIALSSGTAKVTYQAGKSQGIVTITAIVYGSGVDTGDTLQNHVTLTQGVVNYTINLASANGALPPYTTTGINATVYNSQTNQPVPNVQVYFAICGFVDQSGSPITTNVGTLSPTSTFASSAGVAVTNYTASTAQGTVTIGAWCGTAYPQGGCPPSNPAVYIGYTTTTVIVNQNAPTPAPSATPTPTNTPSPSPTINITVTNTPNPNFTLTPSPTFF